MFSRGDPAFNLTESFAAARYVAEAAVHAGRRADARDLMPAIEALGGRTPAPARQTLQYRLFRYRTLRRLVEQAA
jgi:hypothetical protein